MKTARPVIRKALALATATALSSICLAQSSKSKMVTERMLGNATNSVLQQAKDYANSREYTYTQYFVMTNPVIDVEDATITNSFEEAFQGMAFDLYFTNSVYFVDSDEVPTLKFFAPKRRRYYFGNRISCVEIGDEWQVFKTYNQQVDGMIAVADPSRIRFMSTLDRNAPYDQGRSMTLQDYLDAFNPVFVPETIRLFQTNHSDYSIGNLTVDNLTANGAINLTANGFTVHGAMTGYDEEDRPLINISGSEFSYANIFQIKPHYTGIEYYQETNTYGQVTNHLRWVETNANFRIKGNVKVAGDMGVASMSVSDKLYVSGFDDIIAGGWYQYRDENGVTRLRKGVPPNSYESYNMTIADFLNYLAEDYVAATNKIQMGDVVKEVHKMKPGIGQHEGVELVYSRAGFLELKTENRFIYHFDGALVDSTRFQNTTPKTITNLIVNLLPPYGYTNSSSHLDVTLSVDMSATSHALKLDIGSRNFNNFGNGGVWETILSSIQPDVRTETVVHSETYTWYDWIYDENLDDWVEDLEHPYTETYEWYDEYQIDMTFTVEPYSCKEFRFKQVGDKSMRVDIVPLYKTSPSIIQ